MQWLFGPGLDRLDPEMRTIGDRIHRQVYGIDQFEEGALRLIYERHYGELSEWIADRPSIWIHVDQGLDWEPVCDLLGLAAPAEPFPHTNRRRSRLRFGSARKRQ